MPGIAEPLRAASSREASTDLPGTAEPLRASMSQKAATEMPARAEQLRVAIAQETRSGALTTVDPAEVERAAERPVTPAKVRGEAAGAFALVSLVGAAEIELLGFPIWLSVPFVVLGSAIAIDRLRLWRRTARSTFEAEAYAEEIVPPSNPPPVVADTQPPVSTNGHVNGYASPPAPALPAVGYTCVEPGAGNSLAADTEEIAGWCARAGLELAKVVHDTHGDSAKNGTGPALEWALAQIADGAAGTLVVARLRNLSPSLASMPPLLRWFTDGDRQLVAIDLAIDTDTDAGRLAALALAGAGGWENERLSQRTRRGLEAARSRGGGRAGAAVADVPELQQRILRMRAEGMTLQAIADVLNYEGVPTLRGGAKWRPSSVHGATGYRRPSPARGIRVPDQKPDA